MGFRYCSLQVFCSPLFGDLFENVTVYYVLTWLNATRGCLFRYGAVLMDSQHPDGSVGYTVLHNSTCQHAGPIYINVMHSALLRLASGNKNMSIQTRNHPLPPTKTQRLQRHVCLFIKSCSNFLWCHILLFY